MMHIKCSIIWFSKLLEILFDKGFGKLFCLKALVLEMNQTYQCSPMSLIHHICIPGSTDYTTDYTDYTDYTDSTGGVTGNDNHKSFHLLADRTDLESRLDP